MYRKYAEILSNRYGQRIQKISINGGFTCPNRDGSKGIGGCIYCNNASFLPPYCTPEKPITQQIEEGINFFKKYKSQRYIAYFQSYTNTYLRDEAQQEKYKISDENFDILTSRYEEALSHPQIVGIAIGTRPDCIDTRLLDYFAELSQNHYVMIEYGVESTNNDTLRLINRGHTFEDSIWAITQTAERGIEVGCHLILGLPSEGRNEAIFHAKEISKLKIDVLKLHQLQIIKETVLHKKYILNPEKYPLLSLEEYMELLIDFIEILNPAIALDRFISQSPAEWLVAPKWNIKNFEFTHKLEKRMMQRRSYQGKSFC